MEHQHLQEAGTAAAKVAATPGVFLVGIRRPAGGEWHASVGHDSLRTMDCIADDDPSLFTAVSADIGDAVEKALEAAAASLQGSSGAAR